MKYEQEGDVGSPSPGSTGQVPQGNTALPEGGVAGVAGVDVGNNAVPGTPADSPGTGAAMPEGQTDRWQNSLPTHLKENESIGKFATQDAALEAYINLEAHTGNSIRIPGADASTEDRKAFVDKLVKNAPELMVKPNPEKPEQMEEFFSSMGRPADSKDYAVPPPPEGLKEGDLDNTQAEAFKEVAHAVGLNQEQYQYIVNSVTDTNMRHAHEGEQAWVDSINKLKTEWGHAYGDRYTSAYKIAAKTEAPAALLEGFKSGYVQPDVIDYFYKLSTRFASEGRSINNDVGDGDITNAPAEAQAKIDEIMNNKGHAYWDHHHPDHNKALAKMVALRKEASPGAETGINSMRAGGWSGNI